MIIQLQIRDESELYNRFDPTRTRIDERVYNYLKSFCFQMRSEKQTSAVLKIITDQPINADRFKESVQNAVKKDSDEFDGQIALNNKRAIWALIMGILLSGVGVALSVINDQVLLAIISLLGTMGIRDAVAIWTKVNPDVKQLKQLLEPLSEFELEVAKPE